jgi:hypothetical protein
LNKHLVCFPEVNIIEIRGICHWQMRMVEVAPERRQALGWIYWQILGKTFGKTGTRFIRHKNRSRSTKFFKRFFFRGEPEGRKPRIESTDF